MATTKSATINLDAITAGNTVAEVRPGSVQADLAVAHALFQHAARAESGIGDDLVQALAEALLRSLSGFFFR